MACAGTALLASPALATTETFNYTGAAQTWTVPAGVSSASFDLFGAQGGFLPSSIPGLGGHATATIPVTAGDSIQVNVGGRGATSPPTPGAGGFNGGGNGTGQGGGGASDIRIGGTTLNQRVLVAGGGGGGGGCSDNGQTSSGGGGGGLMGADGFRPGGLCSTGVLAGVAGGGGTPNAGGTATSPATTGTFGSGGNAAGVLSAGGGGGGWYGGGGGFLGGAGGGGSGNGPAETSFETGVHSGDGQVTITYTAPTPTAGEHPNCKKLRKKLKRQQKGLANAGTEAKRAMIQANIKDTKKRLKKRGCKPVSK